MSVLDSMEVDSGFEAKALKLDSIFSLDCESIDLDSKLTFY
ncbi:hypothetical protein [uncultured Helicobacter sp.]